MNVLLNICSIPGTVLGAGDMEVNRVLAFTGLMSRKGKSHSTKKFINHLMQSYIL